jgi:hypothetical protein
MTNADLPLLLSVLCILSVFGQGSSGSFSSFAGVVQVFPLDLLHGFSCSSAVFLSGPARAPFGLLHCWLIGLLADRVWQGNSSPPHRSYQTRAGKGMVVLLPFLMQNFVESRLAYLRGESMGWERRVPR